MLKSLLISSAAILLAIASTPATGRPAQESAPAPTAPAAPASTNPVKSTPASQTKAKDLYSRDCALCHGDNGNGKTDIATSMQLKLDDWTDPKTLEAKSDQQLFDAIRKGKGDKMPAEDVGRAKNDEVWNLIIYIRGLYKAAAAAPAPAPDAVPTPAPAQPTN
jgi:cytochrome c5